MSRLPSLDAVHVLVVEDNADYSSFLTVVLEQRGARVTAASTVGEAITAFDRETPDAVVCDLAFGRDEPDGYAFIVDVRRRPETRGGRVPVVAMTGYTHDHARHEVLAAGFDAFCPKPCSPDEVVTIVARLVGRAS